MNLQAQNYGVAISDVQITGPDQASSRSTTVPAPAAPSAVGRRRLLNLVAPPAPGAPTWRSPPTGTAAAHSDDRGSAERLDEDAGQQGLRSGRVGSASVNQTFTIKNLGDFPTNRGLHRRWIAAILPGLQRRLHTQDRHARRPAPSTSASTPRRAPRRLSIFVITAAPCLQVGPSGRGYAEPGVAALLTGIPEVGRTLGCDAINAEGDLPYRWIRNGAPRRRRASRPSNSTRLTTAADPLPDHSVKPRRIGECRLAAVGARRAQKPRKGAALARRRLVLPSHRIDPIDGVVVGGTTPATPDSPLTFTGKRKLRVDLAGLQRNGKRVRYTPRGSAPWTTVRSRSPSTARQLMPSSPRAS